jgi:hypothetical protein
VRVQNPSRTPPLRCARTQRALLLLLLLLQKKTAH